MKSKHTENRQTGRLYEVAKRANSESMSGDLHWSKQEGAVNPLIALNKDPIRAKRIGEINKKREKEKAEKGEHQWQDPEVIARLVQQRVESGILVENGKKTKGKLWWSKGTEQTRAHECPGEGWVNRRLPFPPNPNKSLEATENRRNAQLGKTHSKEHNEAISKGMRNSRRSS